MQVVDPDAIGHSPGALSRSDARKKTYSGGIPFPRIHSVMNWDRIFSFLLSSSTPPSLSAARCKVCPYSALLLTIRSEYYAENAPDWAASSIPDNAFGIYQEFLTTLARKTRART